jgi:hypothetical protein
MHDAVAGRLGYDAEDVPAELEVLVEARRTTENELAAVELAGIPDPCPVDDLNSKRAARLSARLAGWTTRIGLAGGGGWPSDGCAGTLGCESVPDGLGVVGSSGSGSSDGPAQAAV